jgi:glycosyltransferase involved in cell wall biosynthesis
MNLSSITPVVLTWNEEPNLRRCLDGLRWAGRVVVVDSGSDDGTLAICAQYPNVSVEVRRFDNHTNQWNHGVTLAETDWILSLDADYVVNGDFVRELESLAPACGNAAWYAPFRFLVYGRPLRGSLYPPRAVLFDRNRCRYVPDGHTQLLQIEGPDGTLRTPIDHDDRKPLARWFESQRKYAVLEAEKLLAEDAASGMADLLRRRIWPAAPAVFLYTLFAKGAVLDGWPGWFYVLQRTCAEVMLSLILLEKRLFQK